MARGKRQASGQLMEDEEHQLRYERVAGTDVAKASGVVCVRLPAVRPGGPRVFRTETVAATTAAVLALAGRLLADGVQMVTLDRPGFG